MQGFAHHGQHTPRLPYLLQIAQASACGVESFFIDGKALQFFQTAPHQPGSQGGTSQPRFAWRGNGLQHAQQVRGFRRGKNGISFGEIRRLNTQPT